MSNPVLGPFPLVLEWMNSHFVQHGPHIIVLEPQCPLLGFTPWPATSAWPVLHARSLHLHSFTSAPPSHVVPTSQDCEPNAPLLWWMHSLLVHLLSLEGKAFETFQPASSTQPNFYHWGRWLLVYVTEIKGNKFSVTQHFASKMSLISPFTFISILRALSPVGPWSFRHLFLLLSNSDVFLFRSSTLAGSDLIPKIPFPQFCFLPSYCIFLLFPLFVKVTSNKIDFSWHHILITYILLLLKICPSLNWFSSLSP